MRLLLPSPVCQYLFDPVNLHGDVGRCETRDVRDGCGIHPFQIGDDDLPVQWSELQNDLLELPQHPFPINVPRLRDALQRSLDFLETDQFRVPAPFTDNVRSCRVVGYTEGPGLE